MDNAELIEAKRDALHWKFIAAYLASCHAATLESMPKSTSKRERKRQTSICAKAAAYLRGTDRPRIYAGASNMEQSICHDIQRCEAAVTKYGVVEEPQ
jgi:hypothetical protein